MKKVFKFLFKAFLFLFNVVRVAVAVVATGVLAASVLLWLSPILFIIGLVVATFFVEPPQ